MGRKVAGVGGWVNLLLSESAKLTVISWQLAVEALLAESRLSAVPGCGVYQVVRREEGGVGA